MVVTLEDHRLLLAPGVIVLAVLYYSFLASTKLDKFWSQHEFSGLPNGLFARFRGGLTSIKSCRASVHAGYEKSVKTARGFLLPMFGSNPIYILPTNDMRGFMKQTDSVLDPHLPQTGVIQAKYTLGDDLVNNPYHVNIVKNQLTRKLGIFTNEIADELALGFVDQWGRKADWTPIKMYPTSMAVVSRAANRVFAGTVLCRNETFLNAARDYTIRVFACGSLINLVPKLLHPLLAPLMTLPVTMQLRVCYQEVLPIIKERMAMMEQAKRTGDTEGVPSDVITWLIEESLKYDAKRGPNEAAQYEPTRMCQRLLALNMVAVHTTSVVSTNFVLDLFSSPNCEDTIAGLREEIDRVHKAHNNQWTKAAIDDLIRVDSAIRECIRFSPLQIIGMQRQVIDPAGVDFGSGVTIPRGAVVATANSGIHRDPRFYSNPNEFDAFRFSRPMEEHLARESATGVRETDPERLLELKKLGLVTTGDSFLGFGHGRHACPGRFFASQEIKLMVIYMLTNYDIRLPDGKRPPNSDFNNVCIPNSDATIEVKWRGKS